MASLTNKPLRDILILTQGSRGDVQPYIALARGLKSAGYNVSLMTNNNHKKFVGEFEIACLPCFPDTETMILENKKLFESMCNGDIMTFVKGAQTAMDEHKEGNCKEFMKALEESKPDLTVVGSCCQYYGYLIRYKLQMPTIEMMLQAFSHNPKRMCSGMPTLPFGLHKYLLYNVMMSGFYDAMTPMDEEMERQHGHKVLHLLPRKQFIDFLKAPPQPQYVFQSAQIKDVLHPCIHESYKFIGECIIPSERQQAAPNNFGSTDDIETFLAAGAKPIYCGWGSMTCKSPEYMVELVVRALMHCGQRAIVLGGWAGLSDETLRMATSDETLLSYARGNVLFVMKASHEWLFPQVACTVHHGGAGTTCAAIRAGVPTIITPVFIDQWDHAHLVNELGIGKGFNTQLQKISAAELGDAIKMVVESEAIAANAKEMSAKLLTEDGVQSGVKSIEHYWEEWIQTGKNNNHVSHVLKKFQNSSKARGLANIVSQICAVTGPQSILRGILQNGAETPDLTCIKSINTEARSDTTLDLSDACEVNAEPEQ